MDGLVSAALQEVAVEGSQGCTLPKLWAILQSAAGVAAETVSNKRAKQLLWQALVNVPGMRLSLPNSVVVSKSDHRIQDVDNAEKLGVQIVASESLRDSSLGLYDLRVCDTRLSKEQRRILECIAKSRSKGITQTQLANEFKIAGNKMFYVVKMLEVRGLVVRQATLVRPTVDGNSEGNGHVPIVATNLLHLTRFAKVVTPSSHQRFEIFSPPSKNNVPGVPELRDLPTPVRDNFDEDKNFAAMESDCNIQKDLPAVQTVCEKLEETDGKVQCFDCKEYGRLKETASRCSVRLCGKTYHDRCLQEWGRPQPKGRTGIACPHHYCDVCWNGQSNYPGKDRVYKCVECPKAYHEICIPDGARLLKDVPGFMLCAKHSEDRRRTNDCILRGEETTARRPDPIEAQHPPTHIELRITENDDALTGDVKVAFDRLPLPSVPQEFKLPLSLKSSVRRYLSKPSPYQHIRRNIYLVKRPRKKTDEENTQCSCHAGRSSGACDKDCLCGILLTSCSPSCKCGDACTNLPFQKRPVRKLKAEKTENCGWGLKVEEDIKAGDFLVEYVGEVIDDETCEKRLWALKEQGESNFYMCEISREIVIDATFKGNLSRFINHSCSPNSELQKWEIEGEIRIGVFARQGIKNGEFVSYDYQFVQFGTDQMCHCGALGCRGQLGKPFKQKIIAERLVKSTRTEALLTRPSRRSKMYRSFSVERGCTPISGVFRQQQTCSTNSFGEALKVVEADVHYQQKGRNNCVGLRVRVWWPLDQKFYHGKIVRYDPKIDKHQIMYDDGQEEDLHMAKETWEFETTEPVRPKRSRSPSLDEGSDRSDIVRQRSDALERCATNGLPVEWRRTRTPMLRRTRSQPVVS